VIDGTLSKFYNFRNNHASQTIKMFYLHLLLQFLLIKTNFAIEKNNSDNEKSEDKCPFSDNRNKYSAASNKWQEYLENISAAEAEYIPCNIDSSCSSCFDDVIERDLAPFKSGISQEMIRKAEAVSRVTKYQIIDGQLYRSEDCMFPFRCSGIEHFLLSLAADLPDTELVVNTRDWPQLHSGMSSSPVPVFSFSKTVQYNDIMYPVWAFWCGGPAISLYPRGLGRWDQHRETLGQAATEWPWSAKRDEAMFRGSRTSAERDPLVLLSRQCPAVVDAQYTKNQAWKSVKDTLGREPADEVSLESHCQYKYLFNYRGVAASFRFKHLFLCRSLVFHVGDEWLEYFYPAMKPWIHYIPVNKKADQEELFHLIEFSRDHPEISEKIAEAGAEFIENHLRMSDVTCYWRKLLLAYTKLLSYKVVKDKSLMLVKPMPN